MPAVDFAIFHLFCCRKWHLNILSFNQYLLLINKTPHELTIWWRAQTQRVTRTPWQRYTQSIVGVQGRASNPEASLGEVVPKWSTKDGGEGVRLGEGIVRWDVERNGVVGGDIPDRLSMFSKAGRVQKQNGSGGRSRGDVKVGGVPGGWGVNFDVRRHSAAETGRLGTNPAGCQASLT